MRHQAYGGFRFVLDRQKSLKQAHIKPDTTPPKKPINFDSNLGPRPVWTRGGSAPLLLTPLRGTQADFADQMGRGGAGAALTIPESSKTMKKQLDYHGFSEGLGGTGAALPPQYHQK